MNNLKPDRHRYKFAEPSVVISQSLYLPNYGVYFLISVASGNSARFLASVASGNSARFTTSVATCNSAHFLNRVLFGKANDIVIHRFKNLQHHEFVIFFRMFLTRSLILSSDTGRAEGRGSGFHSCCSGRCTGLYPARSGGTSA